MWVEYQDVINRWNGHGDDVYPLDEIVTLTFIEDSELQILKEFPDLQERITSGELHVGLVKQVVARMITSFITNGNGLSQHSKTVGPYTDSRSYSSKSSRAYLELTEADKELLAPKGNTGGLSEIQTISSYGNVGAEYGHSGNDYREGWRHWGWMSL